MATGDDVGEFPGVVFPFPDEGDVVGLDSLGIEVEVDAGVEVVVGVVADVGVGVVDVVDTALELAACRLATIARCWLRRGQRDAVKDKEENSCAQLDVCLLNIASARRRLPSIFQGSSLSSMPPLPSSCSMAIAPFATSPMVLAGTRPGRVTVHMASQ